VVGVKTSHSHKRGVEQVHTKGGGVEADSHREEGVANLHEGEADSHRMGVKQTHTAKRV